MVKVQGLFAKTNLKILIGVVMCLHSSPGNDKSRHLKQVTASPKSNILLCLKSKGFEFLSAIHLSLMKHLL